MTATKAPLDRPRPRGNEGKSPFRYPGGKAYLLPEIANAIERAGDGVKYYAEPYAGGAGAAIELLANGTIEHVFLNDADPRIAAAWRSMLEESEAFLDLLDSTEPTIQNWHQLHKIVSEPEAAKSVLELGFATYFLNRTNRSGIILGAGPIGGYAQAGKWKLDARFYRETMRKRIVWLAEHKTHFTVSNLDGVEFIRSFRAERARNTFFFIDPPYVGAGGRLYLNTMTEMKHTELAAAIRRKPSISNWLMTYDDCPLIRDLYSELSLETFPIRYSLQRKRAEKELCIQPS